MTIQSTDLIGSGFAYSGSGGRLIVLQDVTIANGGQAVNGGAFSDLDLLNNGEIVSESGNAVNIDGTGSRIVNSSTGTISNSVGAGPSFTVYTGGSSSIDNDGAINHAGAGWAVVVGSTGNAISNDGTISSTGGGVLFEYLAGSGTLVNTGTISAGNLGTWGGAGLPSAGIGIGTTNNDILNLGTVSATTGAAIAMTADVTGTTVNNAGHLVSSAGTGINLANVTAGIVVKIENSGTITGETNAILGGAGIENIINTGIVDGDVLLGLGNDTFSGLSGSVLGKIVGGSGNDKMFGGVSDDAILGNVGDDNLRGAGGDDVLTGGVGRDYMKGGAGADSFIFTVIADSLATAQRDHILDFVRGSDVVSVSGIDARTGVAGNQAFTFIGDDGFNGVKGELRYVKGAVNTVVSGDTNGDGNADFSIQLDGRYNLTASDFIL